MPRNQQRNRFNARFSVTHDILGACRISHVDARNGEPMAQSPEDASSPPSSRQSDPVDAILIHSWRMSAAVNAIALDPTNSNRVAVALATGVVALVDISPWDERAPAAKPLGKN